MPPPSRCPTRRRWAGSRTGRRWSSLVPVRRFLPFALVAALVVVGIVAPIVTRPRPTALPWDAPLTFGPDDVGGPRSEASAEIWRPTGPPPYPVVMILSGCAG